MTRPSWDDVWMQMADTISQRSRCDGRQIGAVIVSADNGYCVTGYNGPPATWPTHPASTCQTWCPRRQTGAQTHDYGNCVTAHAEANALIRAEHSMIQGGTIYVTSSCCWECGKLIANSGLARVVMLMDTGADAHRKPAQTIGFMSQCGLDVRIYE